MEQSEESQEIMRTLSRDKNLVGGTFAIYERGVETARDAIHGSRICGQYQTMKLIGKTGKSVSFSANFTNIKRVGGVYQIICQPEGWDTFELAIAPRGVEIPRESSIEEEAVKSANSNQ